MKAGTTCGPPLFSCDSSRIVGSPVAMFLFPVGPLHGSNPGESQAAQCNRLLGGNLVLASYQAASIVPSGYMTEPNVAGQGAEERNSVPNEHGHASDKSQPSCPVIRHTGHGLPIHAWEEPPA